MALTYSDTEAIRKFKRDVCTALTVSISLWKDATPSVQFPDVSELLKIELGRVLCHPKVFAEIPGLRVCIGADLIHRLQLPPWHIEPRELLDEYIAKMHPPLMKAAGRAMVELSYFDVTFDIIRRKGMEQTATAESLRELAKGLSKDLGGLSAAEDVDLIVVDAEESYKRIFSQLS